mgnify:FL=1
MGNKHEVIGQEFENAIAIIGEERRILLWRR